MCYLFKINDSVNKNEWMNEQFDERTDWTNKRTNGTNKWSNFKMNDQMKTPKHERKKKMNKTSF